MNEKVLNYQFSIFGDFSDISPNNSKTVIELLEIFKDRNFIPSIFQEIPAINIIPSAVNNRIMLSNADEWQMNIGNMRVDLSMTYKEKTKYSDMNIENITFEACEILKIFLEKYNKKCNRIALNTFSILNTEDSKKFDTKYQEKGNILKFYNENHSQEWNERLISQREESNFNNEKINIGINISKGKGQFNVLNRIIPFDGILIQTDINTTPEITTHRFDVEEIKNFYKIALAYKKELEENIQEIIEHE